jgi:hypothetical protein
MNIRLSWGLASAISCAAAASFAVVPVASGTTPCGGLEECKVLVEINATDGDIGFHWLADGEDYVTARILDPGGTKIFENRALAELSKQYLTETFGESAEPKCRKSLAEPGEDVVTLSEFVRRFPSGQYTVTGVSEEGDVLSGKTPLTYYLPAAPSHVAYSNGVVTWQPGTSLGVCATEGELWKLVGDKVLPVHPMNVPVREW